MMRSMFLLLSLLVAGTAQAAHYQAGPGSTLGFVGSFQGEDFEGQFKRFTVRLRFDPAALASSELDVVVELASAGVGQGDGDELLRGAAFFDTARQPQARFKARKFRALGGARFAADGELSLRGVRKPVTLVFAWTPGPRPVLAGSAAVKRLDFGIGAGEWADTGELANEVRVRTRLVLLPLPAAVPANP